MGTAKQSKSSAIRSRLNHPVIDSDGHWIEFRPVFLDYLREVGGRAIAERFVNLSSSFGMRSWLRTSKEERRRRRIIQPPWWGLPIGNTLDRATSMLPKLLYERLDELGIDFAVLFPSMCGVSPFIGDEEVRQAACRAYNRYATELFAEFSDRLTPAAVIPMHTPQEAIAELEYAHGLGMKVAQLASLIRRPIEAVLEQAPQVSRRYAVWLDTLGLDSAYDYDPVWRKCLELKMPPTFHSASEGYGLRSSISNMVYNHVGHFAAAGEAVCKSLFLGGVTRRFPNLKFAFLEGGVGWGCNLLCDLIEHWEIRNVKALEKLDPALVDREGLLELCRKYGGRALRERFDEVIPDVQSNPAAPEQRDDFAACRIERAEDIGDLFVPRFYFGCESDDRINAWAFNTRVNPFNSRLNALFSSDISHFDVPDMSEVLEESWELVENGAITQADFRDFVFANPLSFFAGTNPDFFAGTVIAGAAGAVAAG
jgi:predicted TIM-barrel fold metal-dependent hydrolase